MTVGATSLGRNFTKVAIVHVVILLLILAGSYWKRFFHKPVEFVTVDFVVQMPPAQQDADTQTSRIPEPDRTRTDDIPIPDKKDKPRKLLKKNEIRVSERIIEKKPPEQAAQAMSMEEIRKLLAEGAKIGDKTSIPDDSTRGLMMVHKAFHDAWLQPAAADAGTTPATAEIQLAPDGSVMAARITGSSGNAVMDASVEKALAAVRKISGLSPDFIAAHRIITISFRVE